MIQVPPSVAATDRVRHRNVEIDGIDIFYREAGVAGAPVVLLPHGYPSSSFQFRNFMPALADRWRLVAPARLDRPARGCEFRRRRRGARRISIRRGES